MTKILYTTETRHDEYGDWYYCQYRKSKSYIQQRYVTAAGSGPWEMSSADMLSDAKIVDRDIIYEKSFQKSVRFSDID